MTTALPRPDRARVPLGFLLAALAVFLIDGAVARSSVLLQRPDVIAPAVTFDLTIFVTFLYWMLVVRRNLARPRTALPVFLASIAAAALTLPPGHRQFVLYVRYLGIPLELAALVLVVVGVRRAQARLRAAGAELDIPERIRAAVEGPVGYRRVADVIATEFAIFYYALASWRREPFVPRGAQAFSYHRETGAAAVFYTLVGASLVELAAVHFLLRAIAPRVALAVLAVSIFATVWLLGFARALKLRPVCVSGDVLHVRSGMAWALDFARGDIARVEVGRPRVPGKRTPGYLRAMAIGQPNVLVTLRASAVARGPYGRTRTIDRFSLALDDPRRFARTMEELGFCEGAK